MKQQFLFAVDIKGIKTFGTLVYGHAAAFLVFFFFRENFMASTNGNLQLLWFLQHFQLLQFLIIQKTNTGLCLSLCVGKVTGSVPNITTGSSSDETHLL